MRIRSIPVFVNWYLGFERIVEPLVVGCTCARKCQERCGQISESKAHGSDLHLISHRNLALAGRVSFLCAGEMLFALSLAMQLSSGSGVPDRRSGQSGKEQGASATYRLKKSRALAVKTAGSLMLFEARPAVWFCAPCSIQ